MPDGRNVVIYIGQAVHMQDLPIVGGVVSANDFAKNHIATLPESA